MYLEFVCVIGFYWECRGAMGIWDFWTDLSLFFLSGDKMAKQTHFLAVFLKWRRWYCSGDFDKHVKLYKYEGLLKKTMTQCRISEFQKNMKNKTGSGECKVSNYIIAVMRTFFTDTMCVCALKSTYFSGYWEQRPLNVNFDK